MDDEKPILLSVIGAALPHAIFHLALMKSRIFHVKEISRKNPLLRIKFA